MKKGWKTKTLEEACQFSNGLWKGEKPPFVKVGVIRNTNFTKEGTLDDSDIAYLDVEAKKLEKRRLQFGDIILEKSGGGPKQPVGRVALFDKEDGDFSFSNFTAALRVLDPDGLDFRFVHKFLHWTYVSGVTEGMQSNSTGIRNLDGDAYKSIEISFPPLAEQQRIVGLLDEAFEGLATAKANAEKNLQNARALFESHLQSVFTQRGPGWKTTTLGAEIDLLAGFAFKSAQYTNGDSDIRLLRGDNIIQGCLRWDDVKRWPADDTGDYDRYQLEEGDVVLAMDRPWVKAGLKHATISADDLPCLLVQRTARLRGGANLDNRFLKLLIGSSAFTAHILGVQTGIGVPHISGQQIKDFEFARPPLADQRRIAANLESLHEETQRLAHLYERKLAALEALKKSLLHQAFTGAL